MLPVNIDICILTPHMQEHTHTQYTFIESQPQEFVLKNSTYHVSEYKNRKQTSSRKSAYKVSSDKVHNFLLSEP